MKHLVKYILYILFAVPGVILFCLASIYFGIILFSQGKIIDNLSDLVVSLILSFIGLIMVLIGINKLAQPLYALVYISIPLTLGIILLIGYLFSKGAILSYFISHVLFIFIVIGPFCVAYFVRRYYERKK